MMAASAAVALMGLLSVTAQAATGPKMGPKESWDDMQKYEYYIGQLSAAVRMCNYFELSSRLKALADLTPYGRQGWQSLQAFDSLRGGRCGSYADSAKDILADRERLRTYLAEKYDCPGGICAPEGGDDSATAICRPEAEDHLAALPLGKDDVMSVTLRSRQAGATRLTTGREGHEAWVRLNSCSGWLIIELSKACHPRQAFTRGDCTIEGISRY